MLPGIIPEKPKLIHPENKRMDCVSDQFRKCKNENIIIKLMAGMLRPAREQVNEALYKGLGRDMNRIERIIMVILAAKLNL